MRIMIKRLRQLFLSIENNFYNYNSCKYQQQRCDLLIIYKIIKYKKKQIFSTQTNMTTSDFIALKFENSNYCIYIDENFIKLFHLKLTKIRCKTIGAFGGDQFLNKNVTDFEAQKRKRKLFFFDSAFLITCINML